MNRIPFVTVFQLHKHVDFIWLMQNVFISVNLKILVIMFSQFLPAFLNWSSKKKKRKNIYLQAFGLFEIWVFYSMYILWIEFAILIFMIMLSTINFLKLQMLSYSNISPVNISPTSLSLLTSPVATPRSTPRSTPIPRWNPPLVSLDESSDYSLMSGE